MILKSSLTKLLNQETWHLQIKNLFDVSFINLEWHESETCLTRLVTWKK